MSDDNEDENDTCEVCGDQCGDTTGICEECQAEIDDASN